MNTINKMKKIGIKIFLVFIWVSLANQAFSQTAGLLDGANWITYAIIALVGIIALFFVIQVADSFLAMQAKAVGVDTEAVNVSIFPKWNEIVGNSNEPSFLKDHEVKKFRRGHDILLEGEAKGAIEKAEVRSFAVQPQNFIGMSPIPKVVVEVGQKVQAGEVLFFDKKRPEVKYVAPVSGEVVAVNRAAKRAIDEIVILADAEIEYKSFPILNIENSSREELVNHLLESGAWTMIRQRPYNVVAEPEVTPRDIFISTFDSAPLAPDSNIVVTGREKAFQKGLDVLSRLTSGKVYLGLNGRQLPASAFRDAKGVEKIYFKGKHPAGNVGIQIHHVKPIGSKDKVWTLDVQGVITIGTLLLKGRFDASRVIALTGAELKEPKYVNTYIGANIAELLKSNLANDHVRFISGDVLSGKQKSEKQFLNYYDDQVTVLEEGDDYELFGWLLPLAPRPSISNTFPNFLFPDQKFKANTNTHGEKRAFVVTTDYEQVMPVDILVQPLMKAIMTNDLERMEGLGILELIEEDVALCEFVCTSKMPLQQILREGLEAMREQS
jgi:Na+-transporting NADH:ubiquinone oxidoreductase subunit A